ncbi:uncharacterized protein N7496_010505 [Penicillium cataractarum]|uniref:F-box domain-containing protein n=1 Tax=Penicillium cataractarum TaxID=2100454 RepID=A0A9W9RQY7_9EURO|nr:uncharacterized protein N7496_010505 [Penicillium cataractarum]KAJ5364792.1 hypothetical protein N7496_010505 [Penicillium cataractarum]
MAFLSMPPEIITRIVFYVPSIRDLAALSQSCRALHSLCDMKTRERFYRIRVYPNDTSINETFGLLMEILRQRSLGHYVREIEQYWRPSSEISYVGKEEQRDLSAGEMNLIRAAVQRAGFVGPQESAMINMLMQNTTQGANSIKSYYRDGSSPRRVLGTFISQALAAILISVSPGLEALAMTQPFQSYYRFYLDAEKWPRDSHVDYPLDRLLRRANADPANTPYLQNLRKVYMIVDEASLVDDERFYIHIDFIDCMTLFDHLPSIESMGTDALGEDENDISRLVPRSSNISKIHLNHCALGTPYLACIIQSSKALREFQYTIGGRGVLDGSYSLFNVKTFIKSICPHKDTLEVLDVDAESCMYYLGASYEQEGLIDQEIDGRATDLYRDEEDEKQQFIRSFWGNSGSLKDFRALKRLSLGIGFLLYFAKGFGETDEKREPLMLRDGLPKSLEYLCIRGYERGHCEKWDAQIDALMAFYKSGLSNIKEIKGVEETIPNARNVERPDDEEDSLWTLEHAG